MILTSGMTPNAMILHQAHWYLNGQGGRPGGPNPHSSMLCINMMNDPLTLY